VRTRVRNAPDCRAPARILRSGEAPSMVTEV
jgi:hypothetical protein